MKKGDISIQVIVVAAIALIVLVVLVLIFTGKIGNWGTATKTCDTYNGICAQECNSDIFGTKDYPIPYPGAKCDAGLKCCVKGAI